MQLWLWGASWQVGVLRLIEVVLQVANDFSGQGSSHNSA